MNKKKSAHVRFTHVVQFGSVFFASCGLRIHHPTRKMYNISITIWPGKIERERERKKHGSKPKHTYQKALYMCLQSWASDWFFSRFSLSYSWLMCFCIGVQFGVNSFLSPPLCVCVFSLVISSICAPTFNSNVRFAKPQTRTCPEIRCTHKHTKAQHRTNIEIYYIN